MHMDCSTTYTSTSPDSEKRTTHMFGIATTSTTTAPLSLSLQWIATIAALTAIFFVSTSGTEPPPPSSVTLISATGLHHAASVTVSVDRKRDNEDDAAG